MLVGVILELQHCNNCNTATRQETFFEKNPTNIREPQWQCCNFALGTKPTPPLPKGGSLSAPYYPLALHGERRRGRRPKGESQRVPKDGKGVVPLQIRYKAVVSPFPTSEIERH